MRYALIISVLVFISEAALALSLSPMREDKLAYTDFVHHELKVVNHYDDFMSYDIWVSKDKILPKEQAQWVSVEVLGGDDYKMIRVPINKIEPDELEVYYICVQENPIEPNPNKMQILVRMCAKLRLYYPLSELQTLG